MLSVLWADDSRLSPSQSHGIGMTGPQTLTVVRANVCAVGTKHNCYRIMFLPICSILHHMVLIANKSDFLTSGIMLSYELLLTDIAYITHIQPKIHIIYIKKKSTNK